MPHNSLCLVVNIQGTLQGQGFQTHNDAVQ